MLKYSDNLWIFTEAEFNQLPDGIVLTCIIKGQAKTKGIDNIDMDTRGGHIAWGVDITDHPERELFLTFKLKA